MIEFTVQRPAFPLIVPEGTHLAKVVDNVLARFFAKVRQGDGGCWEWTGGVSQNGYARFWVIDQSIGAYRFAYEVFVGPIPEGLQIDHLCGNTLCVNPQHLEAVTGRENQRRSGNPAGLNARKTHCKYGHAFDVANTYINAKGNRQCRACQRAWAKRHSDRHTIYMREYRTR